MNQIISNESEHIKLRINGTASMDGAPFELPISSDKVELRQYEDFYALLPEHFPWKKDGEHPVSIVYGKWKEYPSGVRIFIVDKKKAVSSAKGKPVYKVSPLSHGGMMREARVSGNIKLELPLLKDGKLADLGDLVQDLMTAYYNIEWELEAKTLFSDNAA